jgi:hypothetical protein
MTKTMKSAILLGDSTVELREFPVPERASGQVLMCIGFLASTCRNRAQQRNY